MIACGRFYPKDAKTAEARLRHYASRFPLVEVDSSYYAMPSPGTAQRWAERTPPGFVMNVKAFRLFTGHQTSPAVLHKDIREALGNRGAKNLYYKDTPVEIRDELWRRFREALAPLRHAGRLGLVHFQFPPWLLRNGPGHEHVRHCVERMAGHTVSVEFRNKTWFERGHVEDTLRFERDLGVVHTVVDGPQGFESNVPMLWELTHPDHALVRLHGRNAATWDIKGATAASDRFNYDYSEVELEDLAATVRRLKPAISTHVIFNNNMEDQGQRNAGSMLATLDRLAKEKAPGR